MKKNKVKDFIKDPKKALFKLAFPMIIAMVVQVMYNIVDTAFVGRLGAESIAALTFSFPLFFILIAVNSGLAVGMSSQISRYLGAKKKKEAENVAMHGILISVIVAFAVFLIGTPFLKPMFLLFGATGNVLTLAIEYMSIILIGVIFMFTTFIFSNVFSSQGNTRIPMFVQVTALLLNIVLDYVFIFLLGFGVKGAAIATTISFFIGMVMFIVLVQTKSYLHIRRKSFKFSFPILKETFRIGIPASMMVLIISFYMMFLNKFMAHFGTEYVAAFGISTRLESVAVMPIVALSMSGLTLVGMFYGAKRNDLVKYISKYTIKIGVIFTSITGLIIFLAPQFFLRIFTPEDTIVNIGIPYLRLDVFTFPMMAVGMNISRIMQALGHGLPGFVISLVRVFIVAVPLAYLFVFVLGMGYLSIAVAMVLGGLVSSLVAVAWLYLHFRRM